MLNIYYIDIDLLEFSSLIKKFDKIISSERKKKISNFKFDSDKKRSLLGEILILYALIFDFSINIKDIHFLKTRFGKPYLKNLNLHFSISHSNAYVVCAVSTDLVGVDIEKYGVNHNNLWKYFHPYEQLDQKKDLSTNKINYFYDLWSMKESYTKYLGLGLLIPLNSFCIQIKNNEIEVFTEEKQKFSGNIDQLFIDSDYACSVCYNARKINTINKIENSQLDFFSSIIDQL